jgi:hypothetical protein
MIAAINNPVLNQLPNMIVISARGPRAFRMG